MSTKCRAKDPATCRIHGNPENSFDKFLSSKANTAILDGQKVPIKKFSHLTHVGTLELKKKKMLSYEGEGLSVSDNPEAWMKIAKLRGEMWMMKSASTTFLDYHSLTEKQINAITSWGLSKGYVEHQERFVVSWYDDEWDETFTSEYSTLEEAENERMDDELEIEKISSLVATQNFPDRTVKAGDGNIHDQLTAVWVNSEASHLDGVWWEDTLDVNKLSAPRGVVSVGRIPEWISSAIRIS